jgi:microcystin-dependent protein
MSTTILTPNMNLVLPIPGQELGPQYAIDINAAFVQVDGHDHANGEGVRINPAGLNINTDLPFNGNNITLLNATEYISNVTPLPGSFPFLNTTYFSGGNFFVNDGAGNQVQITSGGTVNATSSGISSGTATASFVGGVLVVNSNVNTPANIQAGSILIGNNVSGSNFVHLQAPNALGADYSLTLPPSNSTGSTAFLTIDTSNNMGEGPALNGGITAANIAATAGLNPAGAITMYGGAAAPTGYLICDGSARNRTTFAPLFAAIGTAFGVGDGSTTFNIPDLRGIFPRGVNAGSGNDPNAGSRTATNGGNSGDNVGSFQTDATAVNGLSASPSGFSTPSVDVSVASAFTGQAINSGNVSATGGTVNVGSIGLSGDAETRPLNLYVNFIIKT